MRAVRIVGDQPASVKAGEGGHPIGQRRRDLPSQPRSHAVSGDRNRPGTGRLGQVVEIGGGVGRRSRSGVSWSISGRSYWKKPARCSGSLRSGISSTGDAPGTVEDVGREHHITVSGDAVDHLGDRRPQPEGVHDEQDARMWVLVGTREISVGHAVRRGDVNG